MGKGARASVFGVLVVAIAVTIVLKHERRAPDRSAAPAQEGTAPASTVSPAVESTSPDVTNEAALPRLIDFGSTTCIPCKMMAPILEELKAEYKGRLDVAFVDVGKDPNAWQPFNISTIPTQIFLDADDKELLRHEGFISKQDILAKWKELGFNFEKGASRD